MIIVTTFIFCPFFLVFLGIVSKCEFFSNEVSFIWLRPPLQMKVWKTEYRCIINQTPPNNIGFRTMYSPYACHDKGSIYESLSFQNHRHLISSKWTYNSTNIMYQWNINKDENESLISNQFSLKNDFPPPTSWRTILRR
jgi:hypothetical protein